jgi:hypothetical protein
MPSFVPHVTLTSGVDTSLPDPQAWLTVLFGALAESGARVEVKIAVLAFEKPWNKKLFLRVKKELGLCRLLEMCGLDRERWDPHVSLA